MTLSSASRSACGAWAAARGCSPSRADATPWSSSTPQPLCSLARNLVVATFDHGSGAFARRAVAEVLARASSLGLVSVCGRAGASVRATEADWRRARWSFLADAARRAGARVVTAHTLDDQVETVFMRLLRHAGPRGLAALYARSDVARPLVSISRSDIERYAAVRGVRFVEDPSNTDRRHLRNRVRLDILPAILAVRPSFRDELLAIAHRAANWREQIEAAALTFPLMTDPTGAPSFARAPLRRMPEASLRVLWPALAARAKVVLDWRGTERLAAFTIGGAAGQRIQLAGGVEVTMSRQLISFRTIGG